MEVFYYLVFGVMAAVVAALEMSKRNKDQNTSSPFNSFKNSYVLVFSIMMAGDWLQGPYVYYLYSTYGFGKRDIGQLFIYSVCYQRRAYYICVCFGFRGRKRACVTYCIVYILSCITKHSPQYRVLMVGRILGGIATSLLNSAFRSWLIAEHNKWLSLTISKTVFFGNGLVAILSGLFGNSLVDVFSFGPVAPFDAAACFLAIGMVIILTTWSENFGDPSDSKDLMTQFKVAAIAIASGRFKIALLGAIQSLFEASMYTFVFATFILASMLGSSLAARLMARSSLRVENYMQIVFLVSAASLLLPITTSVLVTPSKVKEEGLSLTSSIQLLGFCMRSQYIPEEARSTIMNFFRVPLNLFVCIILYNVDAFPIKIMFGMCSIFIFVASILQRRLMVISENPKGEEPLSPMKERNSEVDPLIMFLSQST
ncbi:hypothetical protein Bca4012_094744 [Brassica carinata]|uniref:Uncharacterized protein n=1 Tax=Brassica carinata TaxID=52824 RepID=A0A8X7PUQ4_BRACI|nr:hypothetical protein Bca52824_076869 [Brassica carinata]